MSAHNEKGLTLVEVLAATVILGILILAFLNISGYSSLSHLKSDQIIDAQRIAEEELSKARFYLKANNALPANPVIPGYTIILQLTDFASPSNYNSSSFLEEHYSLQAVVLVSSVPKILTVTVSWGTP